MAVTFRSVASGVVALMTAIALFVQVYSYSGCQSASIDIFQYGSGYGQILILGSFIPTLIRGLHYRQVMSHFGRVLNHVGKKHPGTKVMVIGALINLGVAIVVASGNTTSYWTVNGEYWGRKIGQLEAERVSEQEYCQYAAESMSMVAAGWLLFLAVQILWFFFMDKVMEASYEHGLTVGDFNGPPVTATGEEIDEISDGNVTDEENDPTAEIHRTREELDDLQVAMAIRASLQSTTTPYQGGILPTRVGPVDDFQGGTVVQPPTDDELGHQSIPTSINGDFQDVSLDSLGVAIYNDTADQHDQESDAIALLDKRK